VVFDSGRRGFLPRGESPSDQRTRSLWEADRLDLEMAELRARYRATLRKDLPSDRRTAPSRESSVGNTMSGGFNALWSAEVLAQMCKWCPGRGWARFSSSLRDYWRTVG
jgi:hypothetical protein